MRDSEELQELLERLRRRPEMYTGERSLASIRTFLEGYRLAAHNHAVGHPDDALLVPDEFHGWVAYRLHFYEPTSGWVDMIRSNTQSEDEAIERFFTLLAEYRAREPHLVAQLNGYKREYRCVTCRDVNGRLAEEDEEILKWPESISLVTYTNDPGFFAYSDTEEPMPFEGFFPCIDAFGVTTGAHRSMLTIVDGEWDSEMGDSA